MCTCTKDIDDNLADQAVCTDMLSGRVMIDLIRTDKWVTENRRNKAKAIFAVFCPFCGEKYPEKGALPERDADEDREFYDDTQDLMDRDRE